MSIEAIKQTSQSQYHQKIFGYNIQEVKFRGPILVDGSKGHRTETILHLRPMRGPYDKKAACYETVICVHSRDQWTQGFK